MTNPNIGRFSWHELVTSDPVAAADFYCGLFGWTVREMPMPGGGTYRIFAQGEVMVAGAMAAPPGVPSGWLAYVGVDDVDATLEKVRARGGKIMVPATTVPDMLRFACAADLHGAPFGVLQPMGPSAGAPPPEVPRPGMFCWDELHTRETAAAKKFYADVFGWSGTYGQGATEGDDAYWHWTHAGREIGGMTSHMGGANVPAHWLAYIAVADVDAATSKVVSTGGKVLMPAMDMPKVGKFSVVQDPTGAMFSPFRSARL